MQRWLKITKESAFGTASVTPADTIYPFLSGANSFRNMTKPEYWRLIAGMGFAVPWASGTQTTAVGATLSIPLAVSQAEHLLGWACQRVATGSKPWATTEPIGDLASCRLEYFWTNFDGTYRSKAWTGCKVASWKLSGSQSSKAPVQLELAIVGSTPQGNGYDASTDPAVAQPLPSVYPTDWLMFQHLRGGFTLGAGLRTNWESIELGSQNRVKPYFDEYRFANAIRFGGRTTTLKSRLRLKATPDDRAVWESGGAQAGKVEFNDGVKKITFDLRSKNFLDGVGEDFPMDDEIYYDLDATNHMDPTATAADYTFAVTSV